MSIDSCTNQTGFPFHIPGYTGSVKGYKDVIGYTFSRGTHEAMRERGDGITIPNLVRENACMDEVYDLRIAAHKKAGDLNAHPCSGTDWGANNRHCQMSKAEASKCQMDATSSSKKCPYRSPKMNKHGYLSRFSVYTDEGPNSNDIVCCKADPNYSIKKPFFMEFEHISSHDPFSRFPLDFRHVRFPKLKYRKGTCWDGDFYIPCECYKDFQDLKYIKPEEKIDRLPLISKKSDASVKFYRKQGNPDHFGLPYFMDPTNKTRNFKCGYTGHIPSTKFRYGESFKLASTNALKDFTNLYMRPHLRSREPIWLDPRKFFDTVARNCLNDPIEKYCTNGRRTYDGHLQEEQIRRRLKEPFDPKKCMIATKIKVSQDPFIAAAPLKVESIIPVSDPLPINVQSNLPGDHSTNLWYEKEIGRADICD